MGQLLFLLSLMRCQRYASRVLWEWYVSTSSTISCSLCGNGWSTVIVTGWTDCWLVHGMLIHTFWLDWNALNQSPACLLWTGFSGYVDNTSPLEKYTVYLLLCSIMFLCYSLPSNFSLLKTRNKKWWCFWGAGLDSGCLNSFQLRKYIGNTLVHKLSSDRRYEFFKIQTVSLNYFVRHCKQWLR